MIKFFIWFGFFKLAECLLLAETLLETGFVCSEIMVTKDCTIQNTSILFATSFFHKF